MDDENVKSFIETVQSVLVDPQHVEQIEAEQQLLQQGKNDVKFAFLESETSNHIIGYLCKDPTTWPSKMEKDAMFKESRKAKDAIKERYQEVKENVSVVIQSLCAEYNKLQEKTELLKEKLMVFEKKKEAFISTWKIDPPTAKSAVKKCQQAIEKIQTELSKQNELKAQLEVSIESLKNQEKRQRRGLRMSNVENTVIERAQNVLSFLESMTGVKVKETSENKLTVDFNETCTHPVDVDSSMTTLCLSLTMHFNNSRLKHVQINVDHFNIKDIVDVAIANNDVPYLVGKVSERWSRHYPMLSEIEFLNQHHAIDWIQKQSQLRVLVGNCGKVMFTLAIPNDYPNSRNITLVDTYGAENVDLEKLPGAGSSMLDWVRHLEEMYGEKD